MSNVKERLTEYIKASEKNISEFEREIGVSNGYISNISKSIQPDKLEIISKKFPDLNIEWLLIGKGEMLKPKNNVSHQIRLLIDYSGLSIGQFCELTKISQVIILTVLERNVNPPSGVLSSILSVYPEISAEWLLLGEGEMLKRKDNQLEEDVAATDDDIIITKPRIPYTAAAGSLTNAVEGLTAEQCEQIPRINIFPDYDFTIIIKGNSMEPKYEGGDEVACKRIDNTSFIQWGKVHILDTAQGILIKRTYEDGDKIRCVSYNPEYPDFSIDKIEIYSMSLVVGLVRL